MDVKNYHRLPADARSNLKRMEGLCGVPTNIISTGPGGKDC